MGQENFMRRKMVHEGTLAIQRSSQYQKRGGFVQKKVVNELYPKRGAGSRLYRWVG